MTNQPPNNPTDLFLHLIITFLTPLFLATTGGDVTHARIAAFETVSAYFARNPTDLLPIAQVIAFGLVSLDSLGRSMNENLSTSLVLRLRANAVSLNRAAERSRLALHAPLPEQVPTTADLEADHRQEQALIADLARTEQRLAQAKAIFPEPSPPPNHPIPAAPKAAAQPQHHRPQPSQPATPPAPPTPDETASRTAWATAMSDVAREFTGDLANLPPIERRQATMRATALNSVAQHLLSNQPLPPSILRP